MLRFHQLFFSNFQHMIRYRYLPFTHSKPKYQGHDDSGKVIRAKWLLNGEEVGKGNLFYICYIADVL